MTKNADHNTVARYYIRCRYHLCCVGTLRVKTLIAMLLLYSIQVPFVTIYSCLLGETCTSPKVESRVYTTSEEQMSTETVVVVELSLACKNGAKVSKGFLCFCAPVAIFST